MVKGKKNEYIYPVLGSAFYRWKKSKYLIDPRNPRFFIKLHKSTCYCFKKLFFVCFFFFLSFYGCTGGIWKPWELGLNGAAAACLCHRHGRSNVGSNSHLQPMPKLLATLYPQLTEQDQGLNLHPHRHIRFLTQ